MERVLGELEFSETIIDVQICPTADVIAVQHGTSTALGICLYRLDGHRIWCHPINKVSSLQPWPGNQSKVSFKWSADGVYILLFCSDGQDQCQLQRIIERETGEDWAMTENLSLQGINDILLIQPSFPMWLILRQVAANLPTEIGTVTEEGMQYWQTLQPDLRYKLLGKNVLMGWGKDDKIYFWRLANIEDSSNDSEYRLFNRPMWQSCINALQMSRNLQSRKLRQLVARTEEVLPTREHYHHLYANPDQQTGLMNEIATASGAADFSPKQEEGEYQRLLDQSLNALITLKTNFPTCRLIVEAIIRQLHQMYRRWMAILLLWRNWHAVSLTTESGIDIGGASEMLISNAMELTEGQVEEAAEAIEGYREAEGELDRLLRKLDRQPEGENQIQPTLQLTLLFQIDKLNEPNVLFHPDQGILICDSTNPSYMLDWNGRKSLGPDLGAWTQSKHPWHNISLIRRTALSWCQEAGKRITICEF